MAKLSSPRKPEGDIRLVKAFLNAVVGLDDAAAGKLVGLSDEWVRQRRAEIPFERLKGPTRLKIEALLEGRRHTLDSAHIRPARDIVAGGELEAVPPAPTFVEHVLFTAGRIAELANQIASAAAQQQRVSHELGQRAETEGRRPTIAEAIAQGDEARALLAKGMGTASTAGAGRKKRRS